MWIEIERYETVTVDGRFACMIFSASLIEDIKNRIKERIMKSLEDQYGNSSIF